MDGFDLVVKNIFFYFLYSFMRFLVLFGCKKEITIYCNEVYL